ncbi:zinc-binding oxidoreductase-like protein ToxD [Xylariales sp. AK1849]|nr:zinc-binding oxidoreductase-like protein ToxD [Xylariales sp. AK1849]
MASSQSSHPALYNDEDGSPKVLRNLPIPEPAADEVLIEVLFSGVNPADRKHATILGIVSTVMGYDFCGRVLRSGPGSSFSNGDIIAGYAPVSIGRPSRYGAHQAYLVALEHLIWRVPDRMPREHAAALTTVVATAADALYNVFELPFDGEPSAGVKNGPLLIWGASTSVGLSMVQLARASGVHPIFVTASPQRHAMLEGFGATRCFDYSNPDVLSQIQTALEDYGAGPILYGADCAGAKDIAEKFSRILPREATLLSVLDQTDPRFQLPLALKSIDIELKLPGKPQMTLPAQPKLQEVIWQGLKWAVDNYRTGFELPKVDVFEGSAEEAIEELEKVVKQGNFGKLVLKQPLL